MGNSKHFIYHMSNFGSSRDQNYRIFLVPSDLIQRGELILTIAAQCKILKQQKQQKRKQL